MFWPFYDLWLDFWRKPVVSVVIEVDFIQRRVTRVTVTRTEAGSGKDARTD